MSLAIAERHQGRAFGKNIFERHEQGSVAKEAQFVKATKIARRIRWERISKAVEAEMAQRAPVKNFSIPLWPKLAAALTTVTGSFLGQPVIDRAVEGAKIAIEEKLQTAGTTHNITTSTREQSRRVEAIQTLANYAMVDVKPLGQDKMIGLSATSDGKNYVAKVGIENNNITAKGPEVPASIGSPLSVDAKLDDSKRIVVGETAKNSNVGAIALFANGAWETVNPGTQRLMGVQVLPNANSAVLTEGTEASPKLHLFDLATKQRIYLPFAPGSMQSIPQTPFRTTAPNTHKANGPGFANRGYVEITINPNNTVTTQEFNTQEGWAKFIYGWTDVQGRNRVDLVGTDILPTRNIDYIIENIENVQGSKISPKTDFYRSDAILIIKSPAVNNPGNQRFMGVLELYGVAGRTLFTANIEVAAIDDPTNLSKRIKVPNDGDWFQQTGTDKIKINSLNVLNQNNKTFLVASLSDYQEVYNSSTDSWSDVFVKGGIMVRDITNGINSTNPWRQVPVEVVMNGYRLLLPALFKN